MLREGLVSCSSWPFGVVLTDWRKGCCGFELAEIVVQAGKTLDKQQSCEEEGSGMEMKEMGECRQRMGGGKNSVQL